MSTTVIDLFVKATALLAAAGLADVLLRRRASAATRHLVWTLAIAALLALPIASLTLPPWQVRIPVPLPLPRSAAGATVATPSPVTQAPCPEANHETCAATAAAALSAATTAAETSAIVSTPTTSRPTGAASAVGSGTTTLAALALLYLGGVILLLARLALEPLALRRLTRGAEDVTAAWRAPLEDAVRQLRIGRPVRLLQSPRDVMPLTFGTRTPAIVIPACADDWTGDRRRAVLLHELAHVARRDCAIQRLTAFVCALYWPHPGVWMAARRLRVERELACDDRVLAAGEPARDYAGHLLELAHSLGASPAPAMAPGMARRRQLEDRLLAILDAARNRGSLRSGARRGVTAAFVALLLPLAGLHTSLVVVDVRAAAAPLAAFLEQDLTGSWTLRPASEPGMVQITLHAQRSSHGRTVALAQVEALTGTTLTPATSAVHLAIPREAGTFTVEGVCRALVCGGTFGFEPSAAFADTLAKRGIGRPSPPDQFALAIADVGTAYLDALAAGGYRKPDLAMLVRAAQHGVDLGYLREMTSLGYRLGELDTLTNLRDHGVDPKYIRGMADSGYAHLPADELVRARDHGADPEFASGLASFGYTRLPLDTLIGARDHGVDPPYLRGMQALGYRGSLEAFVETRDHGVDPAYVGGLAALGYGTLTRDDLIRLRDHGVDPAYIREMAALGYKGVSADDLVRLRDHGVDPGFVRRVQQRGAHLSVDEIVQRRDRGGD